MSDDTNIIEIPTAPAERVVTPAEYMARFHQVLQALDLPAELDGTHVRYGEMSDTEGDMVKPLMHLIDARFTHVRHEGAVTSA
ncbi:hypothetical protein AB0333_16700 [Citricoccus sp. NPDC079358]|uniref:hypothetical protein n=1 Tax=Citricoccus sp. NPDC079358 TaxID=3154653 RepID=UPI00344B4A87